MVKKILLVFTLLFISSFPSISATNAADTTPLIILMSPAGSDENDGLTLDTPILTLERAQQVIRVAVPKRDRDVEVRIAPGTYLNQTVIWDFTMPANSIKFMPLFNDENRPIFDGTDRGGTWFTLKHSDGQETNLIFHYIRVQNYQTAISLEGDRNQEATSNGSNQIYGCYFYNIGNVSAPDKKSSTAAVRLVNSDDNRIENNHFENIINLQKCGLLHAIYIAHMSDRNKILRNHFENGCGDPIRVRDFSNYNIIAENTFIRIGKEAAYSEWFCDHEQRTDCTKPTQECPSWYNEFRDNILDKNYQGEKLAVWKFLVRPTVAVTYRLKPKAVVHRRRMPVGFGQVGMRFDEITHQSLLISRDQLD